MSEAEIPRPAVILLSGGLDSMVSAALARERGHSLHALTIDYGQRHIRELQSARAIAEKAAARVRDPNAPGAEEACVVWSPRP